MTKSNLDATRDPRMHSRDALLLLLYLIRGRMVLYLLLYRHIDGGGTGVKMIDTHTRNECYHRTDFQY